MLKKIVSMIIAVSITLGLGIIPVSAVESVTWNPNSTLGNPTLEDDNMTATLTQRTSIRATKGVTEGKWYWETSVLSSMGLGGWIGVADERPVNLNSW